MNLRAAADNIAQSWAHSGNLVHFCKRLYFIYSSRLPGIFRKRTIVLRFRYEAPVGDVDLKMRTEDGADGFIHGEVFEHRFYDYPCVVPPETILDLGANIGLTAIAFARRFPKARLSCVEPMPENIALLKWNLAANGVTAHLFPAAIDAWDGRVEMEVDRRSYAHKVRGAGTAAAAKQYVEVPAVSIETVMQQLGWERIGLLKIDIEGHETVLLSSMQARWPYLTDAILIECHDGFGIEKLSAFAAAFGFSPPQAIAGLWLLQRQRLSDRSRVSRPDAAVAAG